MSSIPDCDCNVCRLKRLWHDKLQYKETLKQNAIDWNKKEFYRAINQERWHDAARFKENIERLEENA